MKTRTRFLLITVAVAISVVAAALLWPDSKWARVSSVRIIRDGDSFQLRDGTECRLIGVDAPEKYELGYHAARNLLSRLTASQTIRCETDRVKRDKYGRLLVYAWVKGTGGEFVMINLIMLDSGLVKCWLTPPNIKYEAEMVAVAKEVVVPGERRSRDKDF